MEVQSDLKNTVCPRARAELGRGEGGRSAWSRAFDGGGRVSHVIRMQKTTSKVSLEYDEQAARLNRVARVISLRQRIKDERMHLKAIGGPSAAVAPGYLATVAAAAEDARQLEASTAQQLLDAAREERSKLEGAVTFAFGVMRNDMLALAQMLDKVAADRRQSEEARCATNMLATWHRLEEESCTAQYRIDAASLALEGLRVNR